MKFFVLPAFFSVFLMPLVCHAKTACLWINSATAFGVLDSPADSPMNKFQVTPTACSFSHQEASVSRQLVITVETAKNPDEALRSLETKCDKTSAPLRAIGNEAVMCTVDGRKRVYGNKVYGRVRDSVFTIELRISGESAQSLSKEALEEKATLVAEQVAGNLF